MTLAGRAEIVAILAAVVANAWTLGDFVVTLLQFFPAIALGRVAEHFLAASGKTF